MLLTVFERLVLLNVLPKEGDFATLKIMRELREALSFTEEENAWYQFQFVDQQVRWRSTDDEGNALPAEKEFDFKEKAKSIVRERLKELDKQKKLSDEHYTLYEKFVEAD